MQQKFTTDRAAFHSVFFPGSPFETDANHALEKEQLRRTQIITDPGVASMGELLCDGATTNPGPDSPNESAKVLDVEVKPDENETACAFNEDDAASAMEVRNMVDERIARSLREKGLGTPHARSHYRRTASRWRRQPGREGVIANRESMALQPCTRHGVAALCSPEMTGNGVQIKRMAKGD